MAAHLPQAAHEFPEITFPQALGDLRFRSLLSAAAWTALPAPIRKRFSKRVAGGATAIYSGAIIETEMNRAGWLLAQAARFCGGPLPLSRLAGVPAIVSVTEDVPTGGQIWTRLYARRNGFPQIIHSSKRFAGPTGLEEHVGRGIGMELTVAVEAERLLFRSARYFFRLGPVRLILPRWLTPGALTVTHAELGDGRFSFTLDVVHPFFGRIIHQDAVFSEVVS